VLSAPAPLHTIALLGGSGFVGRALANRLQRADLQIKILTRRRAHARELWSLPNATCVELDVYDPQALAAALAGCSALVNLVGILNERRDDGREFHRVHVALTAHALAAAVAAQVPRFVQMSALKAGPAALSHYLKSRGEAEQLVLTAHPLRTAILQSSVIFGAGDGLFERFAPLVRYFPCMPLAGANTRFQPVFIGDVVEAIWRVLRNDRLPSGLRLELGGPAVWTLRQIVEYTARVRGHYCPVFGLPDWLGRIQAEVCEHLPGKPFSRDNWRSLHDSSVVTGPDGLTSLGITPTPVESVMPQVLQPGRRHRDYDALRRGAHR
jgi:NADH dehydrogenase